MILGSDLTPLAGNPTPQPIAAIGVMHGPVQLTWAQRVLNYRRAMGYAAWVTAHATAPKANSDVNPLHFKVVSAPSEAPHVATPLKEGVWIPAKGVMNREGRFIVLTPGKWDDVDAMRRDVAREQTIYAPSPSPIGLNRADTVPMTVNLGSARGSSVVGPRARYDAVREADRKDRGIRAADVNAATATSKKRTGRKSRKHGRRAAWVARNLKQRGDLA